MKTYRELIEHINTGKYVSLSPVKHQPNTSATISKLVTDPVNNRPPFGDDASYSSQVSNLGLEALASKVADSKRNNLSMLQMFPETELSAQILISSILSPKDMLDTTIKYNSSNDDFPSEVKAVLLETIEKYIEKEYRLKNKLPEILKEILFVSGSYINAVIPESNLDALINDPYNVSTESFNNVLNVNSIGILGDSSGTIRVSMENFDPSKISSTIPNLPTELITITDNYEILKIPGSMRNHSSVRINKILNRDTVLPDTVANVSLENLRDKIFKHPKMGNRQLFNYNNIKPKRKNIGKPLVLRLNSEAVIPVHVPGDPTNHIGYFVLLDLTGNPIVAKTDITNISVADEMEFGTTMLEKAKTNVVGINTMDENIRTRDVFADIVEAELLSRLKNGVYGGNVDISRTNEVYRLMLTRTLQGQFTRILFLPVEIVSYINYEYHDNGIGKTLLDNMRVLNSLRAMVTFSRVMAGVKNSIGITEVKMKLDERDPDPTKTIETAMHEIIRTRQRSFPVGVNTPSDIVDWVQTTGLEISVEGHPKFPDMNFEFNQKGNNTVKPDTELDEELSKRATMALGLTPEMVDNGNAAEFATTIVANNLLFSKRVLRIQEVIIEKLNYYIQLLLLSDNTVIADMINTLTNNDKLLDDYNIRGKEANIVNSFINTIVIELPKPDVNKSQVDLDALKVYIDLIDTAIDAFISGDLFNDSVSGEFSQSMDKTKTVLRNYFIRKWLADNNILSEISELVSNDEDEVSKLTAPFKEQSDYMERLMTQTVRFIHSLSEIKVAVNTDVSDNGDESSSGSDDDDYGSSGSETENHTDEASDMIDDAMSDDGTDENASNGTDDTDSTDGTSDTDEASDMIDDTMSDDGTDSNASKAKDSDSTDDATNESVSETDAASDMIDKEDTK
jgi:hypothetical protein